MSRSHGLTPSQVADKVAAECADQGVPLVVDDSAVYQQIGQIIRTSRESRRARNQRRAS